jgi:hypothetical protein
MKIFHARFPDKIISMKLLSYQCKESLLNGSNTRNKNRSRAVNIGTSSHIVNDFF